MLDFKNIKVKVHLCSKEKVQCILIFTITKDNEEPSVHKLTFFIKSQNGEFKTFPR